MCGIWLAKNDFDNEVQTLQLLGRIPYCLIRSTLNNSIVGGAKFNLIVWSKCITTHRSMASGLLMLSTMATGVNIQNMYTHGL